MSTILQQSPQSMPQVRDESLERDHSLEGLGWLGATTEYLTGGKMFLPLVSLLAIVLRFWALSRIDIISRDGYYYCVVARKIQDGHWLDAAQGWFIFNPYPPLIGLLAMLTGWSIEFSGQFLCALPSALGVIPIFLWVRSAFSRRIAVVTALLYAFHPILIRTSGEVMREGLYWLTMLVGVYLLWESVQKRSIWRAILGGLAATAAMLTRIEGIAIFPLVLMWCFCEWMTASRSRWDSLRLASVGIISSAMLPLTLVVLNLALLPQGTEWKGFGRFQHLAQLFIHQIGDTDELRNQQTNVPEKSEAPSQEIQLASFETFRVSPLDENSSRTAGQTDAGGNSAAGAGQPINVGMDESRQIGKPRDVRDLAKSLPVWNRDSEADPDWYRLQRFLVMADDQAEAVYLGVMLNRLIQGLLIPVLCFCYFGLRYQKGEYWQGRRDWPLVMMTLMLSGVFYFHLTTEHVLEARYLFCLIPFLFPWTAVGAVMFLDRVRAYLAEREAAKWYPRFVASLFLLSATAAVVHAMPRNDIEKTVQKEMGEEILARDGFGKRMVAPESLKRMAFYADTWYFMLPRQVSEIGPWLEANPMDYVILGGKELPLYARLIPQLDSHPGYERVFTEDPRFQRYYVYRSKALGSFSQGN